MDIGIKKTSHKWGGHLCQRGAAEPSSSLWGDNALFANGGSFLQGELLSASGAGVTHRAVLVPDVLEVVPAGREERMGAPVFRRRWLDSLNFGLAAE